MWTKMCQHPAKWCIKVIQSVETVQHFAKWCIQIMHFFYLLSATNLTISDLCTNQKEFLVYQTYAPIRNSFLYG